MNMIRNWKQRILSGWNFMRFIRLGLGIVLLIEAAEKTDLLFIILGTIFLLQAILNVGCCGTGSCEINTSGKEANSPAEPSENITFKEVK